MSTSQNINDLIKIIQIKFFWHFLFRSPIHTHSGIYSRDIFIYWIFRAARSDKIFHLYRCRNCCHLCKTEFDRFQFNSLAHRCSLLYVNFQLVLINVVESIYRREKLRCFFTFKWGRRKHPNDNISKSGDIQLNCCSANSTSQVEEEKSLTRTLVRDKKLNDYAVIVANLYKAYDDSNVVCGIDFAVKQGIERNNQNDILHSVLWW